MRTMRPVLRRLGVLAATLPLLSCVALVDSFDVAEHCRIDGAGTCADCLRASCTAPIDACCGSDACSKVNVVAKSILDVLDACGAGEVSTCASGLGAARTGVEEEGVRQCALRCKAECTQGTNGTQTPVDDPRWTCDLPRTDTTACAQCMYASCGDKLDDCCADSACRVESALSTELGVCLAGDQGACSYVLRDASSDGTSGIVRACLIQNCEACFGDGVAHRKCTPRESGGYCTCVSAQKADGPECAATKIGVEYCVAYAGGCICGAYHVTSANRDECTASFAAPASAHEPEGGCVSRPDNADDVWRCCLSIGTDGPSCKCEDYPLSSCGSSELEMPDCNEATMKGALTPVASCSR